MAGEVRAERVRALLPAAVELLRARFGVGGVWLFGSFANGRPHLGSDVDLAVDVPLPALFEAASMLEDLLDCPVDLVVLPSAAPSLRARVLATGRLL